MTPDPAARVFHSPHRHPCEELALVLRALAIDHQVVPADGGYEINVAPQDRERAGEQLALYREENRNWPPRPEKTVIVPGGGAGVAGFVAVLLTSAWLQTHDSLGVDWLAVGRVDAARVLNGEWWRSITALTLHLDLPHLVGNLVFGALFGFGASQFLGPGAAWLAILLSGSAGNMLNVLLQNPAHRAIGASTAVFGALGIVSLHLWRQRSGLGIGWAYRWAPVIGGVFLLAFLGVGGERTDVVAHLTGFFCGGLLGALSAHLGQALGPAAQRIAAAAALALLIAAWVAGIGHYSA